MRRRVAVAALALGIAVGGAVDRAAAVEHERADALAELRGLAVSIDAAQQRTDRLQGLIEVAQRDADDRDAVLAVRPAFVAEIAAFGTALASADGKVDTASARASAVSAQNSVLAERRDPAVVVAATATVHALTAKVTGDVAAWQAAQQAGPAGPRWSSSGPDGYARVRAALDRVGGAGVGLYESSSCAGGNAPACANSNGYIKYRADIAGWSADRLSWAMAHELAHIYQFRVWGALTASAAYGSMFGGDPEFLANCMAVVRGFPGSVGCSADQQAWASGVWVGVVR
ncbi:hypothetical protein [Microbacterium sp. XT11]|uniref:hypothetical protein n=1 Tax=Microbacterium sp. XT11 TaxID=367477 RepID=UPI000742CFCE|nr:hypothetical protein [Microbacterium sp. XT11]ALX66332.1 hypothetical protein AB663_001410 [Microbacterium sp. XT11]